MVDQFSHLTPECDYDTRSKRGFFYKGNRLAVNGVVINQNYYSHMLAVSPVKENNILIPLAGTHNGLWHGKNIVARQDQGFFIPVNERFQFETNEDEIAGSLIVSYDVNRLNQVLWAMTGTQALAVSEDQVQPLSLAHGRVNLKRLFLNLFAQFDGFGGDTSLLALHGFDDQFYRLLAMAVRPGFFLNTDVAGRDYQAARKHDVIARFERYVEENLENVFSLTALEAHLGVTSRTLQYACLRHHGCSPRAYIRNRRLERAYERLTTGDASIKLASLAFELGFSSQSQFSKFFRERFGVLPSQV